MLARWLLRDCRVLLLDEPTRGVDVGARSEIYALVRDLADRGVAVVVVSSEIPEVLGLADRVLVIADGAVVAEAPADALDEHRVLDLIMEGTPHTGAPRSQRSTKGTWHERERDRDDGGRRPRTAPAGVRAAGAGFMSGPVGRNLGLVIALAILCIVGVITAGDRFADIDNVLTILRLASVIGVVSVGMTFVIIGGGIDLSVGALVALSSVWATTLATQQIAEDFHWIVMVFTAIVVGAGAGLINGVVIAYGKLVAFIATLAMLAAARGLAEIIANRRTQIVQDRDFLDFFSGDVLGIPTLVIIFALVAVAGWVLLNRTTFGRRTFAVGGNAEAARLAGIRVQRHTVKLYVLSGVTCGIAAVMLMARTTTGSSTHGTLYELDAIAAVVIGGTLLIGGRGTIVGTVLGVLIFTTLEQRLHAEQPVQLRAGGRQGRDHRARRPAADAAGHRRGPRPPRRSDGACRARRPRGRRPAAAGAVPGGPGRRPPRRRRRPHDLTACGASPHAVSTTRRPRPPGPPPHAPQSTDHLATAPGRRYPRREHVCNEAARIPSPDVHRGRADRRRRAARRLHRQHPGELRRRRRRQQRRQRQRRDRRHRRHRLLRPGRRPRLDGRHHRGRPGRGREVRRHRAPRRRGHQRRRAPRSARSRPSSTTGSTRSCCCPSTARP